MDIVFNIETAGLPKDEILHLMPEFTAPSNYKDSGENTSVESEEAGRMVLGRFEFGSVWQNSCDSNTRAFQECVILCRRGRKKSPASVLGLLSQSLHLPLCGLRVQLVRNTVPCKAFVVKPCCCSEYLSRKISKRQFHRPPAGLGLRNTGADDSCELGKILRAKIRTSRNSI